MVELYYTLFMVGVFGVMLIFSRSIPVSLFSLYTATWFFPEGIPLVYIPGSLIVVIPFVELLYISINLRTITEKNNKININVIVYICQIILFYFFIALITEDVPFSKQLYVVKSTIYYSLNFIIVLFFKQEKDFLVYFVFVSFLIVISGIYGIYTYINHENPFGDYIALYMSSLSDQGVSGSYIIEERGFLSGRIFGFTTNPLMFGGIVSLFLFIQWKYCNLVKENKWQYVWIILTFFSFVLIVLTGSRSILLGVVFGIVCYYYLKNRKRLIILAGVSIFFLLFVYFVIEDEFLRSTFFFWEDHEGIGGSSSSMRITQFEACVDAINKDMNSLLFGLGHYWHSIYLEKHGNIPPFQSFESILFVKIVTMGFLGTLIYFLLVYLPMWRIVIRNVKDQKEKWFIYSFITNGLIIAIFTGDYYGYRLYLVLVIFLIKYYIVRFEIKNKTSTVFKNIV